MDGGARCEIAHYTSRVLLGSEVGEAPERIAHAVTPLTGLPGWVQGAARQVKALGGGTVRAREPQVGHAPEGRVDGSSVRSYYYSIPSPLGMQVLAWKLLHPPPGEGAISH